MRMPATPARLSMLRIVDRRSARPNARCCFYDNLFSLLTLVCGGGGRQRFAPAASSLAIRVARPRADPIYQTNGPLRLVSSSSLPRVVPLDFLRRSRKKERKEKFLPVRYWRGRNCNVRFVDAINYFRSPNSVYRELTASSL